MSVGAWDSGPFENDEALDFAGRLANAPDWGTVRAALKSALKQGYLDATEASEAVAAAAFVAAAYCGDVKLTPEGSEGVLKLLGAAPVELRVMAAEALPRIAERSELAELWNEAEDGGMQWLENLSAIGARL